MASNNADPTSSVDHEAERVFAERPVSPAATSRPNSGLNRFSAMSDAAAVANIPY